MQPVALISRKPSQRWEANIPPSSVPIIVGEKPMRVRRRFSDSAAGTMMRPISSNGPRARA
jgi:hypothetical protein